MQLRATVLLCTLCLVACATNQVEPSPAGDAGAAAMNSTERSRGPRRGVAKPDSATQTEHPDEPRDATKEPDVFRSAGRESATRVARDAAFQPGGAGATPVWYGSFHSHTSYSDGSGTPEEAFESARAAGLDFLAVTPHNHSRAEMGASGERRDGILIATNTNLYDSPNPQTYTRRFTVNGTQQTQTLTSESVITAAGNVSQADFVGFFGQEFSTISSGNHINVIGAQSVITIASGDFAPLYTALGASPADSTRPVLQFNHPNFHKDLFYRGNDADTLAAMRNDYGFDEFNQDFDDLVAAADEHVAVIEVLTGPALNDEIHPTFHYPSRLVHDKDYYYYLIQGFHISPSVGQDNHFRTWGAATPARMGVLAPQLTAASLLEAIRQNRTFATEDSDLRVELIINGASMGGNITAKADDALDIMVVVSDPTEPQSSYVAELFYGDVVPQDANTLEKWVLADGLSDTFAFVGDGVLTFDEFVATGQPEFFLVRLQQGDGDRAWTAPVWINHPR